MLPPTHLIFEELASFVKSSSNILFIQLWESLDDEKDLRFTTSLVRGCIFFLTRCFPSSASIFLARGDVKDLRFTTLVTSCCTFPLLAPTFLTLGESLEEEDKDLRFTTLVTSCCTSPLSASTFLTLGESIDDENDEGKDLRFATSVALECTFPLTRRLPSSAFTFLI